MSQVCNVQVKIIERFIAMVAVELYTQHGGVVKVIGPRSTWCVCKSEAR